MYRQNKVQEISILKCQILRPKKNNAVIAGLCKMHDCIN